MVIGIEERRMNKTNQFNIKVRRYILLWHIDHLKLSLWKAPYEVIIHTGTKDITNNINYLHNVKKKN